MPWHRLSGPPGPRRIRTMENTSGHAGCCLSDCSAAAFRVRSPEPPHRRLDRGTGARTTQAQDHHIGFHIPLLGMPAATASFADAAKPDSACRCHETQTCSAFKMARGSCPVDLSFISLGFFFIADLLSSKRLTFTILIRTSFSRWEYMKRDFVCQEEFGHKIWGAVSVIITVCNQVLFFIDMILLITVNYQLNSPADQKVVRCVSMA